MLRRFLESLIAKARQAALRIAEFIRDRSAKIADVANAWAKSAWALLVRVRNKHLELMRSNANYRTQLLVLSATLIALAGFLSNWTGVVSALAGLYVAMHAEDEKDQLGYPPISGYDASW